MQLKRSGYLLLSAGTAWFYTAMLRTPDEWSVGEWTTIAVQVFSFVGVSIATTVFMEFLLSNVRTIGRAAKVRSNTLFGILLLVGIAWAIAAPLLSANLVFAVMMLSGVWVIVQLIHWNGIDSNDDAAKLSHSRNAHI